MADLHHGGCLCGKVRYQTEGMPVRSGVCHCRYCQLRAGRAFGVLVYFPADRSSLTAGRCHEYSFISESHKTWVNSFCPSCGTTVFSNLEVWPGDIGVAGGNFDPQAFGMVFPVKCLPVQRRILSVRLPPDTIWKHSIPMTRSGLSRGDLAATIRV